MHKELLHVGADTEPFSLKAQNNVGHGRYLYETVGGSGQRLVSNLVGEGTQCKPLKVDLSYHKTGYTGGAMLLRSVPGFASCRQTCYIPNYTAALVLGLVQLQGSLTAIVENRLASNVLGHLPSASSSFAAITPASSAGWEVVVPTAFPIGTRCKAAGLRSRMQFDLGVPACNGGVPALHRRTVILPVRSCPRDRQLGHEGPVRSSAWLVPRLYYRSDS